MQIIKSNKYYNSNGISYKSGYRIKLTKVQFESLNKHLKNLKDSTDNTYKKIYLNTLKVGFNDTNITTFDAVERYLKYPKPYQSLGNRYVTIELIK